MFPPGEMAHEFPILFGLEFLAVVVFYFAIIWIFGRVADNINKIRKLLERETNSRQQS